MSKPSSLDLLALPVDTVALGDGDPPPLRISLRSDGTDAPLLQLERLLERLRAASTRDHVRAHLGRDEGYRLEDAITVALGLPAGTEAAPLEAWLRRRLARATVLSVVPQPSTRVLSLAAELAGRVGVAPGRTEYARGSDGRLRVEALELHAVEHCNLCCANCCNMSPLVGESLLSVAEVERICAQLAGSVVADVVKLMGGEPLLHPELPQLLHVLRASGLGDRVRVFTNGLLLSSMPEAFWEALDDLTISSYRSAPVKPAILEAARERSRRHGFVLNIKPVDAFSQVLSPRFQRDEAQTRRTFTRCWLRHRCLIARRGRFYMCTRAAYADDFLHNVAHEPVPEGQVLDRSGDGIPIDAPDLAARVAAYLNREEPLGACHYCYGGDGALEPHYQLTRDEVRRGLLSRALAVEDPRR